MLHAHSAMSSRPRRDRTAPIRDEIGLAVNPIPHSLEAIRSARIGGTTTEEWRTLVDALGAVALAQGALVNRLRRRYAL